MISAGLITIVGPTAVGKTAFALALARYFPIEIVSADSRLVYRGMDIGTAKPTRSEQALVPHHLIDLVDPADEFTLADFQAQAGLAVRSIESRGRLPVLVGGTGLYVRAILEGFDLPHVPPDLALREQLESDARSQGPLTLHRRLADTDPLAASRIDYRNVRRVIRALEVCVITGRPFTDRERRQPPSFPCLTLGLTLDRAVLYNRIDQRVDQMIADGLVAETEGLCARFNRSRPALSGLGYRQIMDYFDGRLTLEAAVERIKLETHRFARQQYTWFRLDDGKIHWIEPGEGSLERAATLIRDFTQRRGEDAWNSSKCTAPATTSS